MNWTGYEGWQYGWGSTMALSECILTEDLAWSCLLMSGLADRLSVFLLGELLMMPLNILSTQSLHNSWHLKTFLAWFYRILYLENLGGASAAHPVANFQSCLGRVGYWVNTGKYNPILEKTVLTQLYWEYIFRYCPSRRLWCGSFENSLGNTLCLECFIATFVFTYSIGG